MCVAWPWPLANQKAKEITAYVGRPVGSTVVDFLDTPGVGDTDVTPMRVLSMIEQELISTAVCADGTTVALCISIDALYDQNTCNARVNKVNQSIM